MDAAPETKLLKECPTHWQKCIKNIITVQQNNIVKAIVKKYKTFALRS